MENPSCPLADVSVSLALVSRDVEKVAMEMHLWEAQILEILPPPQAMEAFHLLEDESHHLLFQNRDLSTLFRPPFNLTSVSFRRRERFLDSFKLSLFTLGCYE